MTGFFLSFFFRTGGSVATGGPGTVLYKPISHGACLPVPPLFAHPSIHSSIHPSIHELPLLIILMNRLPCFLPPSLQHHFFYLGCPSDYSMHLCERPLILIHLGPATIAPYIYTILLLPDISDHPSLRHCTDRILSLF